MEFTGRIKKMLPVRSGVSQRTGNEWKSLPFVFEYFENPSDRYADSVVLETFDTKVIDNLKEGMTVRCGFSHKVREYEGKYYNELRLYKIESQQRAQHNTTTSAQSQQNAPSGPKEEGGDDDDLPF